MSIARVILADDHAVVRSGIANALKELPEVTIVGEAGDGPALFEVLAQTRPDCLLIDVTMPNFEPISAIQQIREHYPALKILVVSAYDDDIYVQGLFNAGVQGYHLKDQPLSDLRLAVQRVLAGERWVCSPLVEKLLRLREATPIGTQLTERQREMLQCLHEGLDNQAIARRTGLSVKTIENHLTRLYRLLNVQSRLEAAHYVGQHPELLSGRLMGGREPALPMPPLAILIVDDNARYRSQLRRLMSRAYPHARIHEADQSAAAGELARLHHPQIAFIDVVLGDENGIECARHVKHLAPETRVLLFSAYPDREFHRLGLQAGAAAFLDKKDLDAAALRALIDDVI